MALPDGSALLPRPRSSGKQSFLRKLLGRQSGSSTPSTSASTELSRQAQFKAVDDFFRPGLIKRMSRKVVPGIPRQQTFKRQESERRDFLAPVEPCLAERRAVSAERRSLRTRGRATSRAYAGSRASAPSFLGDVQLERASQTSQLPSTTMGIAGNEAVSESMQELVQELVHEPVEAQKLSHEPSSKPLPEPMEELSQEKTPELEQVPTEGPVPEPSHKPVKETVQEPKWETLQESVQELVQETMRETMEETVHEPIHTFGHGFDQDDESYSLNDVEQFSDRYSPPDEASTADARSMTTSQYDALIHEELERTWILNLSMHFRDRSKREKFFVTYRENEHLWRRVTVSLDYRDAPTNSLEMDLIHTKYQRDKSAKIYEAIRESLADIQFYDTVTNLKLETTDGRLHVHVVEDGNEIIHYPSVSQIRHLGCRRIRERDIVFDSHMSGFVYKVSVHGRTFIKKEIPSPDTIEEFLYEVNALNSLRYSDHVIKFHGVVVDDHDDFVKGLLISFADQGALIDLIYENCKENTIGIPWSTREKWAKQIVQGLADIHDSGFVQGDFTLSNIVVDDAGDAKIIDINRRGCPMGWEPPEMTHLIESNQRLTMYIGVKSDLYQLGMVLWGLAMLEDEPETQGRPLMLGPEINIPDWFRQMTEICLNDDPRMRVEASTLLDMFPRPSMGRRNGSLHLDHEAISVDDGHTLHEYLVDGYSNHGNSVNLTVEPANGWAYTGSTYVDNHSVPYEPYHYARGRSPPSPLPSNYDRCESPNGLYYKSAWAANRSIRPSYSDSALDEMLPDNDYFAVSRQPTPTPTAENMFVGHFNDWNAPSTVGSLKSEVPGDVECEDASEAGFGSTETTTNTDNAVNSFDDDYIQIRSTSADAVFCVREDVNKEHVRDDPNIDAEEFAEATEVTHQASVESLTIPGETFDETEDTHDDSFGGASISESVAEVPSVAKNVNVEKLGTITTVPANDHGNVEGHFHEKPMDPKEEPQTNDSRQSTADFLGTPRDMKVAHANTVPFETDITSESPKTKEDDAVINGVKTLQHDHQETTSTYIGAETTNTKNREDSANANLGHSLIFDEPVVQDRPLTNILSMENNEGVAGLTAKLLVARDIDEQNETEITGPTAPAYTDNSKPETHRDICDESEMDRPQRQDPNCDGGDISTSLPTESVQLKAENKVLDEAISIEISNQDAMEMELREAEPESEPEYIASRNLETTKQDAHKGYADNESTNNVYDMSNTYLPVTHLKNAGGIDILMSTPMGPPPEYSCPRQASVPVSLTGIGASHLGIDGDYLREKGVIDDDFNIISRPNTAPIHMITTDAKT